MISFTCGTYHGLFVDTGLPSVLPKDVSYFDFRARGGRLIPLDETPNLIVRYNSSADQSDTPMIMVALCYRAIEGNREGFIAFGSLIFEPFSSKKIIDGIKASIEVARTSKNIFDGKVISKRPLPKDGRPLDLTQLPLFEVGHFFGELNANISNLETIENIAVHIKEIIASGIDHFEILVNPNRGMKSNVLIDHFHYLVSQHKKEIDALRERTKRLRDQRRLEASFQAQRLVDRRNRNALLLQIFAFGVSGIALLGLVVLIVIGFLFSNDQTEALDRKVDVAIGGTNSNLESDPEGSFHHPKRVVNLDRDNCSYETLSDDDKMKVMIFSDLITNDNCIQVHEDVSLRFSELSLNNIITTKIPKFTVASKLPENKERLLTSFGRLFDGSPEDESISKYVDDGKSFVLPDSSFSLAISMEPVSPKLICTSDISERARLSDEIPNFFYYTEFQGDYSETLKWLAGGVLQRIGKMFYDLGEEISIIGDPRDTYVPTKLKTFGEDLVDFSGNDGLDLLPNKLGNIKNTCVVLVSQGDQLSFEVFHEGSGIKFDRYSIDDFFQAHAIVFDEFFEADPVVFEKYRSRVKRFSKSACHKIPGLFMVWNSGLGERFIMKTVTVSSGVSIYNLENFNYKLEPGENFRVPLFNLPDLKKFDDLKRYFSSYSNFSPFFSDLYAQEDFCFMRNSVGR